MPDRGIQGNLSAKECTKETVKESSQRQEVRLAHESDTMEVSVEATGGRLEIYAGEAWYLDKWQSHGGAKAAHEDLLTGLEDGWPGKEGTKGLKTRDDRCGRVG